MKRAVILLFLFFSISALGALAQRPGLRIMPIDELTVRADEIVRGHVEKVEKANYLGTYTQLATLRVFDVIKGNTRLKEVKIWTGSQIINAADSFIKDRDMLVFLVHEQTFYRLLNYQHGQFLIEGDTVRGWRVPLGGPPANPPNGGSDGAQGNPQDHPEPAVSESSPQEQENEYALVDKSYIDVRKELENYLRSAKQPEPSKKATSEKQ